MKSKWLTDEQAKAEAQDVGKVYARCGLSEADNPYRYQLRQDFIDGFRSINRRGRKNG